MGAKRNNLHAKIAGGAQMFKSQSGSSLLNIGERNTEKTHEVLHSLGIRITGEDTGGTVGRTMILDCSLKKVFVRTVGSSPKEI
jgi:chemotaxis protein CheD